jgi:hypothetical protein
MRCEHMASLVQFHHCKSPTGIIVEQCFACRGGTTHQKGPSMAMTIDPSTTTSNHPVVIHPTSVSEDMDKAAPRRFFVFLRAPLVRRTRSTNADVSSYVSSFVTASAEAPAAQSERASADSRCDLVLHSYESEPKVARQNDECQWPCTDKQRKTCLCHPSP